MIDQKDQLLFHFGSKRAGCGSVWFVFVVKEQETREETKIVMLLSLASENVQTAVA